MTSRRNRTNKKEEIDFAKLRGYIGYCTRQAQLSIFRDFGNITQEIGLSPGEFSLLTLIDANPGINLITLAALHNLDKSTLSLAIRKLRRQGLMESQRQPDDGRYFALHLTLEGKRRLKRATQLVEDQEQRMEKALKPGERKQLLDLLARISKALEPKA